MIKMLAFCYLSALSSVILLLPYCSFGWTPSSPFVSKSRVFYYYSKRNLAASTNNSIAARSVNSETIFQQSFQTLPSGSDIRGQFVGTKTTDRNDMSNWIQDTLHALQTRTQGSPSPLTPLAAYCFGYSFAKTLVRPNNGEEPPVVCIGRDPRPHGSTLVQSFRQGAADFGAIVKDTGIATTPSMFEFCRAGKCDGAVMVTASHLPIDRNGFKLFAASKGGFNKADIRDLASDAANVANLILKSQMLPTIAKGSIEQVDFMPHYAATLRDSIVREIKSGLVDKQHKEEDIISDIPLPLAGLRIVLNSGHGSGGFFYNVLHDLGADVSNCYSINIPDSTFPRGIPNPESETMVQETTEMCQEIGADIGIMLDTDADRCGFIVPASCSTTFPSDFFCSDYQPLNRNRLIALLGRIFSEQSPGCAIVTDSVTSEGLATFLEKDLGLVHVRYIKGYANVINKAMELTQSGQVNAEVAIETSGHCAMKENGYLDDGTYTAVKVIACLAKVARERNNDMRVRSTNPDENNANNVSANSLLDLISSLEELDEVKELRIVVNDGSLDTTESIFQGIYAAIEKECQQKSNLWELDVENLEGIRVRTGNDGGFFMLRKSLHDPVLSLQVEGHSKADVRKEVVAPILQLIAEYTSNRIGIAAAKVLDLTALESY